MRKKLLSKVMLLLTMLVMGASSVLGATVTGTITFGNASGSTNINRATITGQDDLGNTWTITTVGTDSWTPSASYSQVGSSKKPATSITFTTTLQTNQQITALSTKMGGFSGTAGTITLKVDETTVGTGSLNGTSDVTTSATTGATGKTLMITVTGISKGVKCYNISYSYEVQTDPIDPTIVVNETENVAYGSTFTVDDSMIEGGDITVTSANEAIATVDGLVITSVAVGTTTITVSTAANSNYNAGSETFTLNVTAPEGKTTAPVVTTSETATLDFSTNGWELPEGSANKATESANFSNGTYTITLAAADGYYFNTDGYLLLGKSGSTLTLPAFDKKVAKIEVTGTSTASGSVVQNIYVGENAVSTATTGAKDVTNSYEIASDYQAIGTIYTLKVTSKHNTQITKIEVYFTSDATYTEDVTLNAKGYATYASVNPLDFSDDSAFSAWAVTDIQGTTITFEKITGAVKGGEGVLLKGEANATISIPSADATEGLSNNLLEGTLAPTYVGDGEYYGLSGEEFVPVTAGTVKTGKAILDAELIPAGVKGFTFVFNGADGVQRVETVSAEEAAKIFDLNGRRLSRMQKGVNIVNGKKVLVK